VNRLEELLVRWQDGALTGGELEEFVRLLDAPSARAEMVDDFFMSMTLREILGGAAAPALRVTRRRTFSRAWLLAAAAVIAIAMGVIFLRGERDLATVIRVQGTVRHAGGGTAAVGEEVPVGAGLETLGPASAASLQFPDGTRVDLNGSTRVSRLDGAGGRRIRVEAGRVTVDTGRPLAVETPQGEARVLGTRFTVSVGAGATRLEVNEGKVRLTRRDGKAVDVPRAHFAVAASGVELAAKPLAPKASPGGAFIAAMPPKSWRSVPGARLRHVLPDPAAYPRIGGISNPRGIVQAWSGGALDTLRGRLLIWGGGVNAYQGNEIYAFDVNSLAWERLSDPSPDPADGGQINADGTPNARATYNGLAYVSHADRFFALGGEPARARRATAESADLTWTFDLERKQWRNMNPAGEKPPTYAGNFCSYDPQTNRVWWGETHLSDAGGLYSYDFDSNRWTRHTRERLASYQTCTVDTKRGLLVIVGKGEVIAYDLRRATVARETWKTTGGEKFISSAYPGLDYDPVADRIVGWAGGAVYALDVETKSWTATDAPGAPAPTQYGIFGRWRYVPGLDVFVVVTGIDEEVHFFKGG